MRRTAIIAAAAALGALAVPGSAVAQDANCAYASGTTVGFVTVYAETAPNQSGASGSADAAVGACADAAGALSDGTRRFDGGFVEVGTGDGGGTENGRGQYAVVDGDNQNADPSGQSDGYFGLSTYEEGANRAACPLTGPQTQGDADGNDTNSGGCFGTDVGGVNLPLPVACGNTSGNTWNATSRDGCFIP
jgi:hypothetical protein